MEFVARLLRSARLLVHGERQQLVLRQVVLRHSGTGAVFTDSPGGESAVCFGSATEACAFVVRFLDEAPAWEVVVASELRQAA